MYTSPIISNIITHEKYAFKPFLTVCEKRLTKLLVKFILIYKKTYQFVERK